MVMNQIKTQPELEISDAVISLIDVTMWCRREIGTVNEYDFLDRALTGWINVQQWPVGKILAVVETHIAWMIRDYSDGNVVTALLYPDLRKEELEIAIEMWSSLRRRCL